jgi:hypothetical protein
MEDQQCSHHGPLSQPPKCACTGRKAVEGGSHRQTGPVSGSDHCAGQQARCFTE